jgi:hypothetical protein
MDRTTTIPSINSKAAISFVLIIVSPLCLPEGTRRSLLFMGRRFAFRRLDLTRTNLNPNPSTKVPTDTKKKVLLLSFFISPISQGLPAILLGAHFVATHAAHQECRSFIYNRQFLTDGKLFRDFFSGDPRPE